MNESEINYSKQSASEKNKQISMISSFVVEKSSKQGISQSLLATTPNKSIGMDYEGAGN